MLLLVLILAMAGTASATVGPEPSDNEAKFVLSESNSVVATLTCGNSVDSMITFNLTRDGTTISGPTTMTCVAGTSTSVTIDTGSQTPNDIEKDWCLYDNTTGKQLNCVHIEKKISLPHWEVLTPTDEYEIPEFSTIAIPVAGILGLIFFFNHRKRRREQ